MSNLICFNIYFELMKRLPVFILLIFLIEVLIHFWSMSISELDTVKYSLASRYSARVTLILFQGILMWIGIHGLKTIFNEEKKKDVLVTVVALITVNHLLHFIFLWVNHWINDYELLTLRSAGGALGYLFLIVAPFYLMKVKNLNRMQYISILFVLFFIDIIFMVGYVGRWNRGDIPWPSDKVIYIGFIVLILVILVMNVYRIFAERRKEFKAKTEI